MIFTSAQIDVVAINIVSNNIMMIIATRKFSIFVVTSPILVRIASTRIIPANPPIHKNRFEFLILKDSTKNTSMPTNDIK